MISKKQLQEEFENSVLKLLLSSEIKYKNNDYKGAVEDKREIKRLIDQQPEKIQAWNEFKNLIKESKLRNSNYDLIQDYKGKINEKKKMKIISMLEERSNSKYISGDYKGAIKAIRRAERYY